VSGISPLAATGIGIGLLVAGWFVYDALWETLGKRSERGGDDRLALLLVGVVLLSTSLFSGRGRRSSTSARSWASSWWSTCGRASCPRRAR
jgi:uncharacterized membrane protein